VLAGFDTQLSLTDGGRQAGRATTDDDNVKLHCFSFHDSLLNKLDRVRHATWQHAKYAQGLDFRAARSIKAATRKAN
jgi:hypothetical protein